MRSESASYAAYMLAKSVSPPSGGTANIRRIDPIGGSAAQDTSDLIKQLKDKQKLQARAKKFDAAIAKLKPLRSKAKFDQKDIEAVDAFINETDDGVPIAVRAQSKAYAAAMDVKQFEDGVRAAAGKDAASFIESLQGNQRKILEISGARSAADAFSGSIREDADTLRTIGEKMKAQNYSIVVGSYDAHRSAKPLSYFSSAGPTRDGRQKPELSAPGHEVRAANSGSVNGVTVMSGTSMASPAVTGAIAILLGEAKARKLSRNMQKK